MRARARSQYGLILGLLASIAPVSCARQASDATAETATERPKVSTDVSIVKAPAPKRYSAALPQSSNALQSWRQGDVNAAPVGHVVDLILQGNPSMIARLDMAAKAVSPSDASAWAKQWQSLLRYGGAAKSFCTAARPVMTAEPSPTRLALAGVFARSCAHPDDLALMVRDDTPDWAVLAYYDPWRTSDQSAPRPQPHARLFAAARETILAAELAEARSTAFALANLHDAKADAALLAIHAAIKDPMRADEVALAFTQSNNAAGRELAAAACRRQSKDAACKPNPYEGYGAAAAAAAAETKTPESKIRARIEQLAALGFPKVKSVDPNEVGTDSSEVLLLASGHAHWFDVETGMYPNEHDSLLRSLALLIEPTLGEAIFAEQPPPGDDDESPYIIDAYVGGKRYRTAAENLGDWYDVAAVLRLLNAVLADRRAEERFIILASQDQTAIVVGAPRSALDKAVRRGLLVIGDPADPENAGKAFEEQVLKSLRD